MRYAYARLGGFEHAEVVAGSDVSQEALLNRRGQEHDAVKKLHTDPEALFSDSDIDVIDVCTLYASSWVPLSIAALQAAYGHM